MNKLLYFILTATIILGQVDTSYSWENGETILGYYGNVSNPQNVGTTNGIDPYDGSAMLSISESPLGGTPQAYLSFIENLSENDVVTASYWGWDDTPGSSPSLRIWGGWASNGDISDYQGSAGGNSDYTGGSGWSQLSYTWTVPSGKEALVIQARLYSGNNDPTVYFIDSIAITSPSTSMITFPAPLSLMADAGTDQTVGINSTVTLNGSGSEGSIASWTWTQLTGLSVIINNNDQSTATFTAPASESSLTFELSVTDGNGNTDQDTVSISVVEVSAGNVFISEYVEGNDGTQKYLEIFNNHDSIVDLQADNYSLRRTDDGDGDFSNIIFNDWGTHNILANGEVIVLAAENSDLYTVSDIILPYNSPLHFNGNDAVGLFKDGVIVDLIGDPNSSENTFMDITLRRNSDVTEPNSIFTMSEWTVLSANDVSGLGQHNANVNAPTATITNVSPSFIADNTETELTAELIPVTGSISSATIYYGTGDILLNTTEMYLESGSTWIGSIPPQDGNTLVQFKIVATDDSGNEGESATQSRLIASSTPNDIDEIHANVVEDQIVTIQGIVTIGSGLLSESRTNAYIQDESGRGLNLFDNDLIELNRGDELRVVGYIDQYFTTVEVKDFIYETISIANDLPDPLITTSAGANSSDFEGTLISFPGQVTETETIGDDDGTKLTIDDMTTVMIWHSTDVTTTGLQVGTEWDFTGIGSQYNDTYQLLVAYDEDIATLGVDDPNALPNEFALYPVFPNPFNPSTTISFTTDIESEIHLDVYDINGRVVHELKHGYVTPGTHQITWDASSLSSGVYFIRFRNNENHVIQKVMLLK